MYGNLQGPPIPDSVEFDRLPLGPGSFVILKAEDKPSAGGDSINLKLLIGSTEGKPGTGFVNLNFRHTAFSVNGEVFGSGGGYLDPNFLRGGIDRLTALADTPGSAGESAKKELSRARLALRQIKTLNEYAGLPTHLVNPEKYKGTKFEGTVTYVDRENNKQRLQRDGSIKFTAKGGKDIDKSDFDYDTLNAQVEFKRFVATEVEQEVTV